MNAMFQIPALCDAIPAERRRELLQAALIRRPSDIGLLMTLQSLDPLDPKEAAPDRIRWLQAAIAVDPRNSAAYTNLGLALTQTGHTDDAVACYRIAVTVGPENATAHNNLGAALNGKGRFAEALPWLEQIEEAADACDRNTEQLHELPPDPAAGPGEA